MELCIMDSGTDAESIERGLKAARDVFATNGDTPEYCGIQLRERANGDAYDEHAVQTWHEAERAALDACFAGWKPLPVPAYMDLI